MARSQEEWGDDKTIEAHGEGVEELSVIDTWNFAGEFENVFSTAPFRNAIAQPGGKKQKLKRGGDACPPGQRRR